MIISCGEALIDFLPVKDQGTGGYKAVNGGSLFNVALSMARLGHETGFLGKISTDFFGDQLVEALESNGVDLSLLQRSDQPSTLAFVSNTDAGSEPQYAFYCENAADRNMCEADLPEHLSDVVEALHFGSFSMGVDPIALTHEALMKREYSNRVISFDPNIRPTIIGGRETYLPRFERLLKLSHIVKISKADLEWLYPEGDSETLCKSWLDYGVQLVVLTDGARGAQAWTAAGMVKVDAVDINVADTVGAGDSFMGGLLVALSEEGVLDQSKLSQMTMAQLQHIMSFATNVAAMTCQKAGADAPFRQELAA